MKISIRTEYALKTVLDLAQHANDGVVSTSCIASRQGIPGKFLEQILSSLKTAGLVASKRGARGGYFLRRPASEMTLADVVRVTEGDATTSTENAGQDFCPFREVWREIDAAVQGTLSQRTIADMAQRCREVDAEHRNEYVI